MTEQDTRRDNEKKETIEIRASQVIAGALAAITAAVLGSTLGVAGTVLGAGIASVITTVGAALYLHSIQRTKQSVQTVRARVIGAKDDDEEDQPDREKIRRRPGWAALLGGSVLAFVLGMLVITGVEWLRGEPLSGGDGTTIGGIVDPDRDAVPDRKPVDRPATDPGPPAEQTTTPTPPPSGTPLSTTPQAPAPTGSTTPPPTTPSSTIPSTGSSPPSVKDPASP